LLLIAAGGIMLQGGAHTVIRDSTIEDCNALVGGGVCTDMADDARKGDSDKPFDRKTELRLTARFINNTGGDVYAGPYFELYFGKPTEGINWFSPGVQWWMRVCDLGDRLSSNGFCEECPAGQYSMLPVNTSSGAEGHNATDCINAPTTGYAPGGAILIARSQHWHHPDRSSQIMSEPYQGCTDCHIGDTWRPDVREIRRWVGRWRASSITVGHVMSCHVMSCHHIHGMCMHKVGGKPIRTH
jgi:hypothetical protein